MRARKIATSAISVAEQLKPIAQQADPQAVDAVLAVAKRSQDAAGIRGQINKLRGKEMLEMLQPNRGMVSLEDAKTDPQITRAEYRPHSEREIK
jgi:hypothetical protein